MSKGREDDSRPSARAHSQRATVREVPAAKYKDGSVGTVAPRGLRGPSLLPGQGAPERINPEEVEFAVLRGAETREGPNVTRAAAGKRGSAEPRSASPTPVSVEVPRARSLAPAPGAYVSTPPSPSARSIQSGTLMSIGSVDPRAPTELSLPSPRPLSVSERAVYLGPEAVVDRTPPHSLGVVDHGRASDVSERSTPPSAQPAPPASSRGVAPGFASARPSPAADSVPPPAQNFARAPLSHPPASLSRKPTPMQPPRPTPMKPPRPTSKLPPPEPAPSAPPVASSGRPVPAQFQIHSELGAVPHELQEDAFDLRSASTQREPLASRKAQPAADGRASLAPGEGLRASLATGAGARESVAPGEALRASGEGELRVRANPSSSSAVTILVDRGRESAPPSIERRPPRRTAVLLGWLLGAAALSVIVALIAAFALRPNVPVPAVSALDGRASIAPPSSAQSAARDSAAPSPVAGAKRPGAALASASRSPKSAARPVSSPASSGSAAPPASVDPNFRVHQSIY